MSIIQYTKKEAELLARLMRAEAESEGELGMLMVGNVGVIVFWQIALILKKYTQLKVWFINILVDLNQLFIHIFINP